MKKFIKSLFALSLILTLCGGAFSAFAAQRGSYRVRLEVADKRVPCRRTVQCLLVKDGRSMTVWTPLYTEIRDFGFRENYSYVLQVRAMPVVNPAADAPPVNYRLERIIRRTRTNGAIAREYLNQQNPGANTMQLEGHKWTLTAIGERAVGESRAYVEFNDSDKRFSGNSGCNRMSGAYTRDGAKIKFGAALATKIFCGGDAGETEKSVFAAFDKTTRYEIRDNLLRLYANNEMLLTFTSQTP